MTTIICCDLKNKVSDEYARKLLKRNRRCGGGAGFGAGWCEGLSRVSWEVSQEIDEKEFV